MRVYKKIGSKERLFEMFENVNKIKLKEWYDEDYYDKPSYPKGIGDFKNIDWKILYDVLVGNENGDASNIYNINDMTDYDGILSPEEFKQLKHFGIIDVINKSTPILGQYKGYNEFYNKAKEVWNKDWSEEPRDPEEKIFNAMQGGVAEGIENESIEEVIKENTSNELGTDSGIFQMLYSYVTKNRITEEEFQVGELTVGIVANPTTWDEPPYIPATHMQPEEGGYPENVQGEISDIIIWDKEGNEYTLSNDALEKLNQKVQFDGYVLDDITEKAANGGEDEYSRADFARKDSMENEGVVKENESTANVNQEIYDELDMRYSPTRRTIPFDEIIDVGEMYGVDGETVSQIAAQVISDNATKRDKDFNDNLKEFIKRMQDNNIDHNQYSETAIWEAFENEYDEGSSFQEFKEKWDQLTKDPNQLNMFEEGIVDNPSLEGIKFNYDQNGNWIPEGYEDKKVALRSLEEPLGSNNWRVALVTLDNEGNLDDIVKVVDTWDEGKRALHGAIT